MSEDLQPRADRTPGTLWVSVVTPEGAAFEGEAASLVIPAHDGEIAFLPGHAAFVGAIGVGELRTHTPDGKVHRWYLEGGVAQVLDNTITILAEHVLAAAKVSADEAQKALDEARAQIPTTDETFAERDQAEASARAKLQIAAHLAGQKSD